MLLSFCSGSTATGTEDAEIVENAQKLLAQLREFNRNGRPLPEPVLMAQVSDAIFSTQGDGASTISTSDSDIVESMFTDSLKRFCKYEMPVAVDVEYMMSSSGPVIKEFAAVGFRGSRRAWTTIGNHVGVIQAPDQPTYDPVNGFRWADGIVDELLLSLLVKKLFDGKRRILVFSQRKLQVMVDRLGVSKEGVHCLKKSIGFQDFVSTTGSSCPHHADRNPSLSCALKRAVGLMDTYQSSIW